MIPPGKGLPNSVAIRAWTDGDADTPANLNCPQSYPCDDNQIVAVGTTGIGWTAGVVDTGSNGITETRYAAGDNQRLEFGKGEPNQICVRAPVGLSLSTSPRAGSDDAHTASGLEIHNGPDGITQTFAEVGTSGINSVMLVDVVFPPVSTYTNDELNQVRFHVKY